MIQPTNRFGTLTVLRQVPTKGRQGATYRVMCDCSYAFVARGQKLRAGKVKCRRCAPTVAAAFGGG